MKMKVTAESIETFQGKKGEQKNRRLLLLGADGDLTEQLCEMNLPADHPVVGKDKIIDVRIREISSIFAGKPRIRGEILTSK
jgi:hypothetical protein